MAAIKIGCYDRGCIDNFAEYVRPFHDWRSPQPGFRREANGQWNLEQRSAQGGVLELQQSLRELGFYPKGELDGIFGYRTQSAVRLFQEYVLTVEGRPEIGGADGIVGSGTRAQIERWASGGLRPQWGAPTSDYDSSMQALRALQQRFSTSTLKGIRLLNTHASGTASLAVDQWTYEPGDIHLVGIRRNENEVLVTQAGKERRNDDLIVLLIEGMRFVFRGSTNPSPRMASRRDAPFLLRGQHRYRFGWHRIADLAANPKRTKVYRALKPKGGGVLVVRSTGDLLTDQSFERVEGNGSINIHWSGSGTLNWSAGCQVVAGMKYIDFRNELIDASGRAAAGYAALSSSQTRGAYNVMMDLMTIFANDIRTKGDTVRYTLLYERDVQETAAAQAIDFRETVGRLS